MKRKRNRVYVIETKVQIGWIPWGSPMGNRNLRYARESKRACEATYPKEKFRVVAYDSTKGMS